METLNALQRMLQESLLVERQLESVVRNRMAAVAPTVKHERAAAAAATAGAALASRAAAAAAAAAAAGATPPPPTTAIAVVDVQLWSPLRASAEIVAQLSVRAEAKWVQLGSTERCSAPNATASFCKAMCFRTSSLSPTATAALTLSEVAQGSSASTLGTAFFRPCDVERSGTAGDGLLKLPLCQERGGVLEEVGFVVLQSRSFPSSRSSTAAAATAAAWYRVSQRVWVHESTHSVGGESCLILFFILVYD